jgi:predicted enzyme related to lactoylglutathione lyase
MAHPVIHAEIRSADPDATRAFFSELFGWTYTDGAFPGYSFVDTGVEGAIPTAIGPLQEGADAALFFVGVEDVEATLARAEELGGRTIQAVQHVPGVSFGVFADAQGHVVGVAAN